jgi:hypothetical protein
MFINVNCRCIAWRLNLVRVAPSMPAGAASLKLKP